jgi:hypothetical protein
MKMKRLQFLFIPFLLLSLPLFQMDQAIDIDWLVCENSLVIKSEWSDPCGKEFKITSLGFDLKPLSSFFNQGNFFLQLKNPLSILLSYFLETSPFWRPPPASFICLFIL